MPPKAQQQVQQLSGVFIYANGDCYRGEYQQEGDQQFRNGQGTYIAFSEESLAIEEIPVELRSMQLPNRFPNDIVKFSGLFNKDTFVEGEITFADGSKYKGKLDQTNYVSGGTYTFSNQTEYTGEFNRNLLHGVGTVKKGDAIFGPGVYRNNFGEGL
ncbi:Conserved_hypothetical protein [Hexamita inflata]|uniref:Uncharacterized protein n=1 Tax=Hexamita inflata TaxID=28002 RepID=A0AA86PSE9_9EUKA|nr:Conserved hypothetical protein [Hexamita inflata]